MTETREGAVQIACLAPEVVACYLDDRLPAWEREGVEAHLAGCERCRDLLIGAFRANAALEEAGITANIPDDIPLALLERGANGSGAPALGAHADAPQADHQADFQTSGDTGRRDVDDVPRTPAGDAPSTTEAAEGRVLPWRRKLWTAGGGLLAAAAVLLLIVRAHPVWLQSLREGGAGVSPAVGELVTAAGVNRYIEPRLTGGFAWGPVKSVSRSGHVSRRLPPDITIAILHIEKTKGDAHTPAQLHALGVAAIFAGNLDEAITSLTRAVEAHPTHARFLTDLSAAYLERSRERSDRADAQKAHDFAQRALAADASLPEAWFNLALAREAAGQANGARQAWNRYLAVEQNPGWREEAARHLLP